MKNLLYKEFRLATPLLTVLFLGFSLMTFIPGYPILCGAFFICLGIFQGYQFAREDNDILYSVLLPIKKTDAVKAKYIAAVVLQAVALLLFSIFTLIRMVFLSSSPIYQNNALMAANPIFIAFVILIFSAFNVIFIGGFFKTAYAIGKPFLLFGTVSFILIVVAEALHHFPGLSWLNTPDFSDINKQLPICLGALIFYLVVTNVSLRISKKRFEALDL